MAQTPDKVYKMLDNLRDNYMPAAQAEMEELAQFAKENGLYAMAVICDGMGGYSEGEVASNLTVQALSWWFEQKYLPKAEKYSIAEIEEDLVGVIRKANHQLVAYGMRNDEQVGTTMSCLLIRPEGYITCQVGDTRIYSYDNKLTQMTVDQSFAQQLLTAGGLSEEEVKNDPRRHMILQCIGITDEVDPVFTTGDTIAKTYVLCSDGFWGKTEAEEWTLLLSEDVPLESHYRNQIEKLKEREEKDNITAVILYHADNSEENNTDEIEMVNFSDTEIEQ